MGAPNDKGGYSIYRITKVIDPPATDDAVKSAVAQLSGQVNREVFQAYIGALKAKTDVVIHQQNLDKKERS